jgi:hypothetical protein
MSANRLDTLRGIVEQNPGDSRTRYMLAMELGNAGETEASVAEYRRIIDQDADYVAAYFHCGQALEKLERPGEAREVYKAGITVCDRVGDSHTKDELQDVLDALD